MIDIQLLQSELEDIEMRMDRAKNLPLDEREDAQKELNRQYRQIKREFTRSQNKQ